MTLACDELVKTLISACKDGVSVLAVLDGASPDTCEGVSSAWARAISEIQNSGWYRQLELSGGDRPLIHSREERILADARAAMDHASGALVAAREQLKQLVVGASSLDDWEASAPERARIETEVARLAEEEDEAMRYAPQPRINKKIPREKSAKFRKFTQERILCRQRDDF